MPVLFITDGLLLLLLVLSLCLAFYVRKSPPLRDPWKTTAHDPVAMGAAVILFFYLLVGLLDSLHFHPRLEHTDDQYTLSTEAKNYSVEVLSLLDVMLIHLRTEDEKTYSAPFATHAYAKETIELADGRTSRQYPRLEYGGVHLSDPEEERISDILLKSLIGLIYGVIAWCVVSGLILFITKLSSGLSLFQVLQKWFSGETGVPWKTIHITLGIVLLLLSISMYLSNYYHIFGTDKVGQDVFYQSLKSIRTGLLIGTLTTLIMLPFAILMGLMAGYFGGLIDDIIQYLYTTLSSIPGVLLIAAAILILQVYLSNYEEDFSSLEKRADMRLLFLCIILGTTSWTGLCRLLRGETIKLREMDYVRAARSLGVGHFAIIFRHLLPNIMHILMIVIVLDFSGLVLAEAVLSYINIGVDPSMHSWGNMINSARLEMAREPIVWWSLASAFVFMFILVLAANLFSDVVRDAFDPRLRGRIDV